MNDIEFDPSIFSPIDGRQAQWWALSAAAHGLMLLLVMSVPDNAQTLELDALAMENSFVQLGLTPEQLEEPVPEPLDGAGSDAPGSARHAGDEGEAGREDAPDVDRRLAIEGPASNEEIEIRKARDLQIAASAGVAGVMVESPWGEGAVSISSDALHAVGTIDGNAVGEANGKFGLGVSGAGRGGGGDIKGSLGIDRIRTKGRDLGYEDGLPDADPGTHDTEMPGHFAPQRPVVDGGLDREIIARVVRQHRREIKACYEQELQRDKTLEGTVKVKFTIAPTGRVVVSSVLESTLGSRAAEACMTRRVRRWVFPEPRGGQMVIVKYPFRFFRG